MKKLAALLCLTFAVLGCQGAETRLPDVSDKEFQSQSIATKEAVARQYLRNWVRLYEASWRIRTSNVGLCGKAVWPEMGFQMAHTERPDLHTTTRDGFELLKGYSPALRKIYGGKGYFVSTVAKNSPAEKAGLKTGDRILRINGKKPNFEASISFPATVVHVRNKKKRTARVAAQKACSYPVYLVLSDQANAFANGEFIVFYSRMVELLAKDYELGLVVGHELAHNTMRHIEKGKQNYAAGTIIGMILSAATGLPLGGVTQRMATGWHGTEFEQEADYVGAYYAARAGYPVKKAADLWLKMSAIAPKNVEFDSTHPAHSKRIVALKKAAAEIMRKKSRGLKLVPER